MTAFLCGSLPASSAYAYRKGLCQNDDSAIISPDYRTSPPQMSAWADQLRDSDVLWTRCSFPLQGSGGNGFNGLDSTHQYWEWNMALSGNHSPKKIIGQVLDSNSNPVSGATVQVFNTATGLLVSTTTSNSDGTYQGSDPNAVNCFAVGYLSGSPDTAGTTIDTITGT